MKKKDALEEYRRQLNEWVAALAVADNEAVVGDLAEGYVANDVHLFTEGNLDKRADVLALQTSFLRPAFDDLDDLIGEYVETNPQIAFTAGPADAEAFLRWVLESFDLTPEQKDNVAFRLARFDVEHTARADRTGHVRFQERLSVARRLTKSLERDERIRVHLNPARGWATLHTREFLDDETPLPARVMFFAVKATIHSAALDEPVPELLEALGERGLTLAEWSARTGYGMDELRPVVKRLAEMGVVAFS